METKQKFVLNITSFLSVFNLNFEGTKNQEYDLKIKIISCLRNRDFQIIL